MSPTCLNCQHPLAGDFCSGCGQRASTERFTRSYLFSREFLSGTFNLDRGFFHTCLNLCYRPGHMVREYLEGKRKEYFNFIAFLLLMLAIEALLWSWGHNSSAQLMQRQINDQLAVSNPDSTVTLSVADVQSVLANQKLLFIAAIPTAAVIPRLVFKRSGYNYLEHIVVVCFFLAMNTLLGVSLGLLGILPLDFDIYSTIYLVAANIIMLFDFILYWQLFKPVEYTLWGRLWRTLVGGFSVIFIIGVALRLAIMVKATT